MHTEINFLREGEGGAAGKMGRGGMGTRCLTTHICGIVIHVVGWPCHPRQKGSENKPKTRKIQSCWAPQGRPRGLFGVYMDPTTHIWGQVYHSGAFHCWPESKLVKKSQKSENVTFGKNLDLAGDPKFCFFWPIQVILGSKSTFSGVGNPFLRFAGHFMKQEKKIIIRVKTMAFFSAFSVFWPPFQKFHLRNWSNSYWTLITHLPIRFCENFWISWIAKPITLASKIWQVGTGLFSKSNPAPIFFSKSQK